MKQIVIIGLVAIVSACSLIGAFIEPDGIPTNLGVLLLTENSVRIGWIDNSSNENGYSVERKTGADGSFFQISTTSENTPFHLDAGLVEGTKYYYRIRAFNDSGYSTYSTEISVTTLSSTGTESAQLEPAMKILTPTDGATVSVPFDVVFSITDWGHADGGTVTTHFHPFIGDGDSFTNMGAVTDLDSPYTVLEPLAPGIHVITLKLANSDHTFIGVEDTIEVTVVE